MNKIRLVRNVKLGIKSLLLHKLRSLLTMLGVVFGVASVIAMLAVGEGSKQAALEQIEKLGTNNIIVTSRKSAESTAAGGAQAGSRVAVYGLNYEDEGRVTAVLPNVSRTVPVRKLPKRASVNGRSVEVTLIGTKPAWFELVRRDLIAGRVLTEHDERTVAPMVVLTDDVARDLLIASHTIGQPIRIGEKVFTVVGIIQNEQRIGAAGDTLDSISDVYIPLSTCRSYFGEIISEERAGESSREVVDLHRLIVEVVDRDQVESSAKVIERLMERLHPAHDYDVSVPLELLRQAKETQRRWNWTLGSIAGISLLVGGIGIMNIMLASVTERTREIGIRRAIGAQRIQIIQQFLTEALLLSINGGVIGLLLGAVILPALITLYSELPTDVPVYSIVLSLGISVFVGVVFGLYPAIRAASLDPIEALRHE